MAVKIFLFTFNRPDLLEVQIKTLQKFIKNEHEIFVIHDSRNDEFVDHFLPICEKFNVKFYHHNSDSGKSPSDYHSSCVQWAYDNFILKECKNDLVVILDHDMFLIEEFDVEEYMSGYDAAGCLQKRNNVEYLWPGLTILNISTVHSVDFNFLNGSFNGQLLDTGGGTCKLLLNKTIKYKNTGVEYPDEYNGLNLKDPNISNGFNFELHLDNKFLHSRNACAWHNNMKPNDSTKTQTIYQILNDFIN